MADIKNTSTSSDSTVIEEYNEMMGEVLDQYRIYREIGQVNEVAHISGSSYDSDTICLNDKTPLGLSLIRG